MPSPTTALAMIYSGLGLTNAVGADQTLTADETALGLSVFNDILEIFSTNNLAVYGQANQTFNSVIGQAVYTIGTGGNWNTTWPVRIDTPGYSTIQGTTFPVYSMTQEEYNLIAVKTQTQDYPNRYLYVNSFPLGLVTLWPTPSAVTPVTFSIDRVLTAVSSAGATISFPPGYSMVFQYRLGVMLAPRFGKKLANYPDVVKIANESFADICRANKKTNIMRYDPALGVGRGSGLAGFMGGY